jgi:hypothetical protein
MLTVLKAVAMVALIATLLVWLAFHRRDMRNALRNTDDFLAG